MVVIENYVLAVFMCVITMICWGSWANTQKLARKKWSFQLFYWDYGIGVLLLTLIFAFTLGSMGEENVGRSFIEDLKQAEFSTWRSALIGGVVFNFANILIVAAIDIAGMAVAFPVGIGIALVWGVFDNYIKEPEKYNAVILFSGVACVTIAIVIDAFAYKKLPVKEEKSIGKGLILSIIGGIAMGNFYGFVAQSMGKFKEEGGSEILEAGMFTPYSALVVFSAGLLLSSFVFNSIVMIKPFTGPPVPFRDYFTKGNLRLHAVGILGGIIWSIGMSFSIMAGSCAGYAISYGLGQGATMIAAFWGVFIWKEFKEAPKETNKLIAAMFVFFIIGLSVIVMAKVM